MATQRENQHQGQSKRGFASMDPEVQRQIASKGGQAAHQKGTAHEFDSEEARAAGRKAHASGNAHEFDSEEAREAGRKGGLASRSGNVSGNSSGTQGGSSEQHARAGSQSHKH